MDAEAFRHFLRINGRSESAASRAMDYAGQFEEYLTENEVELDEAMPPDLESFVAAIESEPGATAKLYLWGIRYYYEFIDDPVMVQVAGEMRRERVERTPFRLRRFRGVNLQVVERLASVGIRNVDELLAVTRMAAERRELAAKAIVPIESLDELVRLSDLARIGGIKSIRARLYLDAGVGSVADLAGWDPVELVVMLRKHVADTDFDGIAPLPGEARHAVETAKRLRAIVQW